jgi:hypothetical protein
VERQIQAGRNEKNKSRNRKTGKVKAKIIIQKGPAAADRGSQPFLSFISVQYCKETADQ